ncbi:MAG: SpoIIIAH-like family protein [Clostridiales bacterium]|jgi:stage III sporulation protein AH|nr:SpoIIIAH-like family protein [Clostridiales bacterium]
MSKFYINRRYKKRTFVLLGMLVIIICVGVINDKYFKEKDPLETSSDYVDYELEQMNERDGQVLVDSINITSLPGTSQQNSTESAIVITSDDIDELRNTDTYFAEIRATIDMDRNEIISMLTDVIAEADDGPEKNNATQQKLKIIEYMNTEKVVENLIENKGFADALVIMTDTSVNVTVNKQDLTQSDVAKILDIVMRETNRTADQIVIQSKY